MPKQIFFHDFGELLQLIDQGEQFRHFGRKYEEQSGERASGCVPGRDQGRLRSGTIALCAGQFNSFDKMAAEVSTVARTRKENDIGTRQRTRQIPSRACDNKKVLPFHPS